jgi:glycerol-3-phosphate dehydrogenase (NAD(P)+)
MPIAREVDAVINHGCTVEDAYKGLMIEKPGHEVHGVGFRKPLSLSRSGRWA